MASEIAAPKLRRVHQPTRFLTPLGVSLRRSLVLGRWDDLTAHTYWKFSSLRRR